MQVILPDEQIHQIKRLIGNLIEQEIKNKLHNSHFDSPFLNKKQTCDSWIKKGLPVIRVGKTVRFDKTEINRWLQNQ